MIYSVLVVDDYQPWRRHVCQVLQSHSRWRVVGEASDGLEAVHKARALDPDLILLDIGLPTMNGLEAARRILAHDPAARILFLTEQRSVDIAEAALDAGARGYLIKSDAGGRLLPAMEAIVNGGRFLSPGLGECAGRTTEGAGGTFRHEAGFYADEASLLDGSARFAERALAAGHAVIVLVSNDRCARIHERLQARGVAVEQAIADGRYRFVNAEEMATQFMVGGWPDDEKYRAAAIRAIEASKKAAKGERACVAVCGDCAPGLWRDGNHEAAIRVERLWDQLARAYDLYTLCPYLVDVPLLDDERYALFQRVCAEHSGVHVG